MQSENSLRHSPQEKFTFFALLVAGVAVLSVIVSIIRVIVISARERARESAIFSGKYPIDRRALLSSGGDSSKPRYTIISSTLDRSDSSTEESAE